MITQEQRIKNFWKHVNPMMDDRGCWEWLGSTASGYGKFCERGQMGHRFSWEIHYGQIPAGMCVCHHCDNRTCVNPKHLFIGTKGDNNNDRARKFRSKHGEDHHAARLTESVVLEIRKLGDSGMGSTELSRRYNLSQSQCYEIVKRKAWKHVL